MTAVERLDEVEARAAAATKGPWETTERPGCVRRASTSMTIALCGPAHGGPTDAEFIAATRQAVPALVAALRAVLGVHKPDPMKHELDQWEKGARAALVEVEAAITAALDVTS